ncbi:4096_t:CDS:1, partial [Acaulospora colombiana]
ASDSKGTCNEIDKMDIILNDCEQRYPEIGEKLENFRSNHEELEIRRKALQDELDEVERQLMNNSAKMQEVESQRSSLLQNTRSADETSKVLAEKTDKLTKSDQEEPVKSLIKSDDKNINGKRNMPAEMLSQETLLKKTKISSSVPSEEMDQLRQRLENVSREHQEIRQNIVTLSTRKTGAPPSASDYTTTASEVDSITESMLVDNQASDGAENVDTIASTTTDHGSEASTSSASKVYEKLTPVV